MLFVTFLFSGIVLFLLVYAYSVLQLKKQNIEVYEKPKSENSSWTMVSFFDRFKRDTSSSEESLDSPDSSMTVGGVTAKVTANIVEKVESVMSAGDDNPNIEERVAPTIGQPSPTTAKLAEEDAFEQSVKSHDGEIAFSHSGKAAAEQLASSHESTPSKIIANTPEQLSAPIEQLAEEFAAQNRAGGSFSEEDISQALNEQGSGDIQAQQKTDYDQPQSDEVGHVLSNGEDAQQDLLSQSELYENTPEIETDGAQLTSSGSVDETIQSARGDEGNGNSEQPAVVVSKEHQDTNNLSDENLDSAAIQDELPKAEQSYQQDPAPEAISVPPKHKVFKADANAIEIVAKIYGEESVLRDRVLSIYRNFDYLFTRHLGVFGKNSLTNLWQDVEQSGQDDQFTEIALSLQLADKTGAMTRKESNTFSTLAIQMADELNKTIEFSMDLDESVERGRMLDELARKYDALVVCNIIPKRRKGFRSTDIKSCTKDLKMMPANNGVFGRFAKVDGVNALRYSLALADNTGEFISAATRDPFQVEEIVVFINVPLVTKPVEAFEAMIEDARKLGAWMDGKLVDKNANNMTTKTLEKIIEQIAIIEKEMRLDGLIAGSDVCKKLF